MYLFLIVSKLNYVMDLCTFLHLTSSFKKKKKIASTRSNLHIKKTRLRLEIIIKFYCILMSTDTPN